MKESNVFQFKLDGQPLSSIEKDVMGTLALLSSLQLQYYDAPTSFSNDGAAGAVLANGTDETNQTPGARSTRFLITLLLDSSQKSTMNPKRISHNILPLLRHLQRILKILLDVVIKCVYKRIELNSFETTYSCSSICNDILFVRSRLGSNSSNKLTGSAARRKVSRMREALILEADVPSCLPSDVVLLIFYSASKNLLNNP